MKKIYICAPNKYEEHLKILYNKLTKNGYKAFYAARDTPQNTREGDIYRSNIALITNADIFIAYFVKDGHYGIDFAVEVGKASEMGKSIIGFIDVSPDQLKQFKIKLDRDIMFKHSFTIFFDNLDELIRYLDTK